MARAILSYRGMLIGPLTDVLIPNVFISASSGGRTTSSDCDDVIGVGCSNAMVWGSGVLGSPPLIRSSTSLGGDTAASTAG